MRHMLIFGLSYTSGRLASRLHATGWCVSATRRSAGPDAMTFDDREAVLKALAKATHILSSIPPGTDGDPVLLQYGDRSEEHTSELQSLMRISYAVFCLKKKISKSQL